MKIKEMLDLGLSDAQIIALLNADDASQEETQEDVQESEQADVQEDVQENVQPNTSQTQEVNVDNFTNTFNEMLKRMNDSVDAFTKKVQNFNINNAQMQGDDAGDVDIFEQIILPKEK